MYLPELTNLCRLRHVCYSSSDGAVIIEMQALVTAFILTQQSGRKFCFHAVRTKDTIIVKHATKSSLWL